MLATIVTPDPAPPAPIVTIHESAALTPRGTVAAVIVRLEDQLAEWQPADRAYCLELLRDLIDEATA